MPKYCYVQRVHNKWPNETEVFTSFGTEANRNEGVQGAEGYRGRGGGVQGEGWRGTGGGGGGVQGVSIGLVYTASMGLLTSRSELVLT